MKPRNIVVLVVVAVLFVVVGLNFKTKPPGGSRPQGAAAAPDGGDAPPPPAPAAQPRDFAARFADLDVAAFSLALPGGGPLVALERDGAAWTIASLYGAPADPAKVSRLLDDLLRGEYAAADGEEGDAGLGYGQGIEIRLNPGDGQTVVTVGFGLDGFTRTYVGTPGQEDVFIAAADLRGDMGVFANAGDSAPDSAFWLESRPLGIRADDLASLSFEGPGYHANFVKDAEGVWLLSSGGPESGVSLDAGEFARWIRDLAAFAVSGAADPSHYFEIGLPQPTHTLRFGFDHGVIASVAGVQAADGLYYVEMSTHPGIPFVVPEWRFNLYFRRFFELFPDIAVSFDPAGVLFADLRRDGVNVKMMRSARGWQAVGFPFAVRDRAVEEWLSALASWRPVDSLNPAGTPRPSRGAPVAEVSLVGDARQFRLGDTHPRLGLPYIILDNGSAFTVSAREAEAMFPRFADLLSFGQLFPGAAGSQVDELTVFWPGRETEDRLTLRRDPNKAGAWLAETSAGTAGLAAEDALGIVDAPFAWGVAGLSDWEPETLDAQDKVMASFRLESGATRSFTAAKPASGNVALIQTGSHAYQIPLAAYAAWLDNLAAARPEDPEPDPEPPEAPPLGMGEDPTDPEDLDFGSDRPAASDKTTDSVEAEPTERPEAHPGDEEPRIFLFPDLYPSDVDSLELVYPGWVPGGRGVRIERDAADRQNWRVSAGDTTAPLEASAARSLAAALTAWSVDAATPWDAAAYEADSNRMRLSLSAGTRSGIGIDLFVPEFGQALAKVDGGPAGMLDFASFFHWLGRIEPVMFAVEAGETDVSGHFAPAPAPAPVPADAEAGTQPAGEEAPGGEE